MYDRRGIKRDTDIAGWIRRCNLKLFCCSGHFGPINFLDMSLVRHEDKSNYVLRWFVLEDRADAVEGLISLDTGCFERPYERYYLIRNGDSWSRELVLEKRSRHGPERRLVGRCNTEVIALPHRGRGSHHAFTSDMYRSYKLISSLPVPMPLVFVYCSGLLVSDTEAQKRVVGLMAKVKIFVLSSEVLFRNVRIGPVKRLSFARQSRDATA